MAWLQKVDYVYIHWDRSQLTPIYSCDIVFIPSVLASGNKNNITLVLEFNYTIKFIRIYGIILQILLFTK